MFLIVLYPLLPLPVPHTPFNIPNSMFFPFISGKGFFFRILVELAFAAWAILACFDAKYRPRLSAMTIGVGVFALIAILADVFGVNPVRSLSSNFERMEGGLMVIHLFLFYVSAVGIFGASASPKTLWHRWLGASLGVATIVGIYGLMQHLGYADIHQGSTRIDASLGNSAYMAVYMLFHVFFVAYLFFSKQFKRMGGVLIPAGMQWLYAVLAIFFTFLIWETQTRGTILGLIGGSLLALALYAAFAPKKVLTSRLVSGSVIGLIIIASMTFWFNRPVVFTSAGMPLNGIARFIQGNEVLNRMASISWKDASNQARQYIWPMAIKGAMERPVLGWGQENFNYIFNANYSPKMYSQEQWFDRAHSVFLDWLVAAGILGLVAYLSLYVIFIIALWRSSLTVTEKSVWTGLLAGYFVHNIFVFDNLASYVSFFALIGFGATLITPSASAKEGSAVTKWRTATLSKDAVEYVAMPIIMVVVAFSLYYFTVRPIIANARLVNALESCQGANTLDAGLFAKALAVDSYLANQEIREQLLQCSGNVIMSQVVPGPTKQAFFELASNEIKNQLAATPKDARMYVLAGSLLNQVGQTKEAETLLEKAHTLSPRKQTIDFLLATSYVNNGKTDQALALLKEAYESAPENSEAQSSYAFALVIAGKESEARAMFHDDPAIFESDRLAAIYASLKNYSKAIAIFNKKLAASPDNIDVIYKLSQLQYAAGQKYQAITTIRKITALKPELKERIEMIVESMQK